MSYCRFPAQHLLLLHPLFYYSHIDGETSLTRSLLEENSVEQDSLIWRSTHLVYGCLFPRLEYQPLEGRRHTLFIPTAPLTRIVYLNFLPPVDTQRTYVLLRFILNEVEFNSVALPVSKQPRGVALGTAHVRPRRA